MYEYDLSTTELQWFKHLWNREKMFEAGVVRANSARPGCMIDIFSIFFDMKVCCVFSLESPHRGDSKKYTRHINIKRKSPEISLIQQCLLYSRTSSK